ncbi:MAG TPA: taurine ABC transporter substrate-binding protein [Hyphomicrobiaceae bacterium]|nr:taurine ABC transporter substrate-binding protein [Hyphomicrobiaceae bacterium]
MRPLRMVSAGMAAAIGLALGATAAMAQPKKEVTFAHQDMIIPYRVLMAAGEIEKKTGYKISWKMFGGGGDVIKAMASGEVPIGEVGSSPATAAASQGIDIQVIWILDDIGNAEQLVASKKSGVTTLAGLKGKKVATPFVSTAHYQLLFALKDAGVNAKEVNILNMRPPEIAAAWERGDIDATFIWDPVLGNIKKGGTVLISAGEIAKKGAPTFDALIVNRAWAAQHKEFVTTLVKMIAAKDAEFRANKAKWVAGSAEVAAIAKIVGAKPENVPAVLNDYIFPTAEVQASKAWLGGGAEGGVARAMLDTARFLKEQGRITDVAADYAKFVTPEFAAAAK